MVYAPFAGEPWCWQPESIAKLTDYQIDQLYIRPAVERANKARGGMPGKSTETPVEKIPAMKVADEPMTREKFVRMSNAMFGHLPAANGRDWGREWDAMQAKNQGEGKS